MESVQEEKHLYKILSEAVAKEDKKGLHACLKAVDMVEASVLISHFSMKDITWMLAQLDIRMRTEILLRFDAPLMHSYIAERNDEEIAKCLLHMDSDDATDILLRLSPQRRISCMAFISDKQKARQLNELIHYDEDVAGGLMAKELVSCLRHWSMEKCKEILKERKGKDIYQLYVVDQEGHFLGSMLLLDCLVCDGDKKVSEVYKKDVPCVHLDDKKEEVAEIMRQYDMISIAVVNSRQRLVGRITIDDVVDVMAEMAEEKRNLMTGIYEPMASKRPWYYALRARLPWLSIGIIGGLLGAQFMGLFEEKVLVIPTLLFFLPLITSTGGNVGIQSCSVVLQAFEHRHYYPQKLGRYVLRMFTFSLLSGFVVVILVGGALFFFQYYEELWLVVISLSCTILVSSILGTLAPWILQWMGYNPVLATGPLITTLNDLIGISIYLGVVSWGL